MASNEETLKEVYQEMEDLGLRKTKYRERHIKKRETLKGEKGRFWQIDVLKVFAMLLVIMDHSTTHGELRVIGSPLWERIAIPIFMVVLGFNWAKSLQKNKNMAYRKLFSWGNYWKNKITHFIIPYSIIYVLSGILALFFTPTQSVGIYGSHYFRYLLFPWVYGPGSWFIITLLITVVVFPLVYMLFDQMKKYKISLIALIITFGIEVGWQFLINFSIDAYLETPNANTEGLYLVYFALICNPFALMSAIGLGVWLSQNQKIFSLRNILIWVLGIISGFCIFIYSFYYTEPIPFEWPLWLRFIGIKAQNLLQWSNGDYNLFFFPYSALIVLIFLNILPKEPKGAFARFISLVSKSTFHILMAQIFYFMIVYNWFLPLFGDPAIWASVFTGVEWVNLMFWPLNVVITFSIGILWYRFEQKRKKNKRKVKDKELLRRAQSRGWIE